MYVNGHCKRDVNYKAYENVKTGVVGNLVVTWDESIGQVSYSMFITALVHTVVQSPVDIQPGST